MIGRVFASIFGRKSKSAVGAPPGAEQHNDYVALREAVESGDLDGAKALASALPPDRAGETGFLVLRGRIALDSGDPQVATELLKRALANRPELADAHFWCAVAYMQQGLEPQALQSALTSERLNPGNADLRAMIGVIRYHQNDVPSAVIALESALEVDSGNLNAHRNLATLQFKQQEWARAEHHFRCLSEAEPDSASGLQGLASSLIELGREEEAWPLFSRAVELASHSSDPHRDYATALFSAGCIDEARKYMDSGLKIEPDSALLHVGRAGCDLITQGSMPQGWAEYEWRLKTDAERYGVRTRFWDGSASSGRRLLIYAEQGMGDVLMFARYVQLVRNRAPELVLQVPPQLGRLMRMSAARFNWDVTEWVERDSRVETQEVFYDHELPLLSLIHVCGFPVERATNPYLDVSDELVRHWGRRLGTPSPGKLRVGLVWAGNPQRMDDGLRCIPVDQLALLAAATTVDFVSLQMEAKAKYRNAQIPLPIFDPTPEIRDFADTAAIMRNLDLVLSIDTAAAHLAGAMGVPCWVLLSKKPDWRWQMGAIEQPWYGHHRSFVVEHNRDWAPVLRRVADELNRQEVVTALLEARREALPSTAAYAPTDATPGHHDSWVDSQFIKDAAAAQAKIEQALSFHQQGKLADAEAIFKAILLTQPNHSGALHFLGLIHSARGEHTAAMELIEKAIKIDPHQAAFHSNLGLVLHKLGKIQQSLSSYDRALVLKPDSLEATFNRGNALADLNCLEEAEIFYDRALAISPDYVEALNGKGVVQLVRRQTMKALASFERALEIRPDFSEALVNRGDVFRQLQRFDEASVSFERALALKPDMDFLRGTCLYMRMHACHWRNFEDQLSRIASGLEEGEKVALPFSVVAFTGSALLQRKTAEIWVAGKFPERPDVPEIAKRVRREKIRIGYFSADFRNHPVSYLLVQLIEIHNRNNYEVFGFSYGPNVRDELRARLERGFDKLVDVGSASDYEIAMLARDMEIDIAVDLGGHTEGGRTGIFSCRAAPVQVGYLGYLGTMGAKYYDYMIADRTLVPEENQRNFVEKIVYLPNSFQVNDAQREISDRPVTREQFGLPETGFVFCCFNNNFKIIPAVFDRWARIMRQVKDSVLWLYVNNMAAVENLRLEAVARGIAAERLIFAQHLPRAEYLARYRAADLFLDTLPYNAGTTASDALWAGLPVLTCMGEGLASRMGASLLYAIGLPELVTNTLDDYEATAVGLATDPDRLSEIREKLSVNRLTTPLFDTHLFAKHIEAAYTAMYERHQENLPPAHIYITS